MEQFVLVPISVYNIKLNKPTVVTKKELPSSQSDDKPTYQIESVKKEIQKELFAEADSLFDKVLSSPSIIFSTWNFPILDGTDTGVSPTDFAQTLKLKNTEFPCFDFTSIDAADNKPSFVLYKNAMEEETCKNCTVKVLQLMVQSKT